jgi:hypothetical protein
MGTPKEGLKKIVYCGKKISPSRNLGKLRFSAPPHIFQTGGR